LDYLTAGNVSLNYLTAGTSSFVYLNVINLTAAFAYLTAGTASYESIVASSFSSVYFTAGTCSVNYITAGPSNAQYLAGYNNSFEYLTAGTASFYYLTANTGSFTYLITDNIYDNQGGSKTFVIDHPTDPNKHLVHGCLEGPEAGVYYRGKGHITNNVSVKIDLPSYVSKIASKFTVQITPIYNPKLDFNEQNMYYTTDVLDNAFEVYGKNGSFFWYVQGERVEIEVEPHRNKVELVGNGPYKWLEQKKH
jgi:hypothetical protein